jgi:hypothetical protein
MNDQNAVLFLSIFYDSSSSSSEESDDNDDRDNEVIMHVCKYTYGNEGYPKNRDISRCSHEL